MSVTLRRLAATYCLFPDPGGLVQEVREKEARFQAPILKERVFPHYLRTALVTKRVNENQRKLRRSVEKRGKDPHHAFTLMLCDVAMSRAYGTATIFLPDMSLPAFPTSPEHHLVVQAIMHQHREGTCGGCRNFQPSDDAGYPGRGVCKIRPPITNVRDVDPCCDAYAAAPAVTE
jgi:hypothetical protein